jgi:DNA modification methylase
MPIDIEETLKNNYELPNVDNELIKEFSSLPVDFWDFVIYEKKYTHDIHTYPAMMIPPIPENLIRIIKKHQQGIKNLLDPFSGSGTAPLEGIISGMNVWGLDLNPLACLISKVKCTPINPKELKISNKTLLKNLKSDIKDDNLKVDTPDFYNIDYWFKDYVITDLQKIKDRIKDTGKEEIRAFYWVVFSQTVRDCSNTRNGEFKLYRMTEEKLSQFNPSVYEVFENNLNKCEESMFKLYKKYQGGSYVEIFARDTRDFDLDTQMDIVITSPPYGDSRTTVAYGQFSRLSLQWLDLEEYDFVSSKIEKERLDKYLLGGMNDVKENDLPSESLRETLKKIAAVDEKRVMEVLSFYIDLDKSIESITRQMKINSYQFWVVGNRTVKKVNIPTNKIISELGKQYNLKTVATIPRNISSKRMPKSNSPTNIKGETVTTMNNENIVVLRREK